MEKDCTRSNHPKSDPKKRKEFKEIIKQETENKRNLRIMFQDEGRFGRISDTRCC